MRIAPTVLFCCLPALAQTIHLQVQPSPNSNNGLVLVELMGLEGKNPVALQWDFSFPESVQLNAKGAMAEDTAAKAQKSIRCEILANREGKTQTCRCILAGGTALLPSGPIANVPFGPARNFRPGRYQLQTKKALAVGADLKKMALKDTQVEVTLSK